MKALPKGQYINRFRYDCRVVTESDGERTSVDFDIRGMRKFVTSLMLLGPAERTPPKRPRRNRSNETVATPVPAATAGAK